MTTRIAWIVSFALSCCALAATTPVETRWLDKDPPAIAQGVSWGVPWPRGAVTKETHFRAADVPVQSWVMAYWPDGSIKWTGHAISATAGLKAPTIAPGEPAAPATPLKVEQSDDAIDITNGPMTWILSRKGAALIDSVSIDGKPIARAGK